MVNLWTRADLPTISAIAPIAADPKSYAYFAVSIALDAVVEHLNAHHPKPKVGVEINYHWRNPDAIDVIEKLTRERDAAVARAEEAERERDDAQERADQLRDERDDAVQSCITVGRARDEWRERAEVAERERDVRGELLDEIAETVYGPPPTDGWWAWDDLAEKVRGLKEQAGVTGVDPVTEKARELYEVVRTPEWRDWDQLNDADHDEYYRLARHVLGLGEDS